MLKARVKPKVNLSECDGNAFALIGTTAKALRKAEYAPEEIDAFRKEAMAGDYDHVIQTCMKWADVE